METPEIRMCLAIRKLGNRTRGKRIDNQFLQLSFTSSNAVSPNRRGGKQEMHFKLHGDVRTEYAGISDYISAFCLDQESFVSLRFLNLYYICKM